MLEVPPVQLLNVFPVTVLFGLVPEPSVLLIPLMVVAPVTVIPEKLLLVKTYEVPLGELAPEVEIVTVPPAPVLLKAVTIELPEMV